MFYIKSLVFDTSYWFESMMYNNYYSYRLASRGRTVQMGMK